MSLIGALECFNNKADIETYIERFEQLVLVNGVEENKKLPLFLTLIGADAYNTLKNLCTPVSPVSKTYKQVVNLFKKHYNPAKIVIFERFRFNKRDQQVNESIADYTVELQRLSRTCDFGSFLDDALRDRLICGLKSEAIQKKLLSESSEKKFEDVYRNAVSMELAFLESKTIIDSGGAVTKVGSSVKKFSTHNDMTKQSLHKEAMNKKCDKCGGSHGKFCPAKNWKCFLCFKRGHGKKMCPKNRKVNSVEDESDDFFNSLSFVNGIENGHSKSEVVRVIINNVPIQMEIDTGAAITVISSAVFSEKFPKLSLTRVSRKYTVANGETLDVVGKAVVCVKSGVTEQQLEMFVFRAGHRVPLLGRPWLDKLMPSWREKIREFSTNGNGVKTLGDGEECLQPHVLGLKRKYPSVFSREPSSMNHFKATIVLKEDTKPIFCKPYSVPYALKPKVEVELRKMVETGVLIPVQHSEWASPIVIVPKKDKSLRICVDFKVTVNKWVDFHHYPLPHLDDILASLSGSNYFTVLDLAGAYQQVVVAENSSELFTINTHLGLFRYTRLTYGISSAPTIFQQIMDRILQELPKTVCYLDDILIAGANQKECQRNVEAVFQQLAKYNVHINENKCLFFRREVEYLGHIISGCGIRPSPSKIAAINNAPVPQNVTQLKAFVGLVNFYRKFMPMMASEMAPLYDLTKKDVSFIWTRRCNDAFGRCKKELSANNLLSHYDPNKELYLMCDASSFGVGAVLSQVTEEGDRPLMFASASLSTAEKNYSQLDKEALAIIFGVKKFHKFLFGRSFVLVTDHQPLVSLFDSKKGVPITAANRLQRWAIILSGYHYTIKYRKGQDLVVPDALSRLPQKGEFSGDVYIQSVNAFLEDDDHLPICHEDVAHVTKQDIVLMKIMSNVMKGWPSSITDPGMKPYFVRKSELTIEGGCLVWGSRVVIPLSLQKHVLQLLHEEHPGVVRMKMLARSVCWWPNMEEEIEKVVKTCQVCQKYQNANTADFKDSKWPRNERVWYRLHADFFHFGGRTLLLVIDSTSKWIEVQIMQGTTAADVIIKLQQIFSTFGCPVELVTDNGPPFSSSEFIKFCQCNGISPLKSPAYVPQANGLAERGVQTVKKSLRKLLGDERKSVDELQRALSNVLFSYRNTPSSTSAETPSSYVLRFEPRTRLTQLRPAFGSTPVKGIPKLININLSKSFAENENILFRLNASFNWEPGIIVKILGLRRYVVKAGDQIRILHQHQIRFREIDSPKYDQPVQMATPPIEKPTELNDTQPTGSKETEATKQPESLLDEPGATLPSSITRKKLVEDSPLRHSTRDKKIPDRLQYKP